MKPLITRLALALVAGLLVSQASAQSPQLINYQAIARDASTGAELANQELYLILKVRSGAHNGDIVFQEEHANTSTNQFGLFNIQIGGGTPQNGNFGNINWSSGNFWLEIDMDAGYGLETLGTMQFVAVPYALHAVSADNVDDDDADPTNELITEFTLLDNQTLAILEGANSHTVDLSGLVNLDDIDPTNELITDVSLTNTTLSIAEGANTHEVDLGGLVILDDIDPTNELQTLAEVLAYSVPSGSAGSQRITDLANPVDEQDAVTKTYVDNLPLNGDVIQTVDDSRVVGLQNTPVATTTPFHGQVLVYNQGMNRWEPQTPPGNPVLGEHYYSFDVSDFVETKSYDEVEKSNLIIFNDQVEYITIGNKDIGNKLIAPLHLHDGSKITEAKYGFRKLDMNYNLRCTIARLNLNNGNRQAIYSWNSNLSGTSPNFQSRIVDLTSVSEGSRTIDNSNYTYRLEIEFFIPSGSVEEPDDVKVLFHGGYVKYSF